MSHPEHTIRFAVACALALAACESDAVDVDNARTVTPNGHVEALAAADRDIATLAVNALADDLGVPIAAITVDTVRTVDWRDSSIGCPQPDQAYLDVITPGHKITLRVDKRFYTVHEANGRAFVCHRRKADPAASPQLGLEWGPMALQARRDLAATLGVAEDQIVVASAAATTWSDTSLGCAEPGVEYDVGDRKGYVLTLRHGSRNFTYHTDLERVIPCPPIGAD